MIINLEALGAGTLSIIEQESSTFKTYRPSSRIKRFVRQASERSGVTYRTSPLGRRDTPATVAMARGIQAFYGCRYGAMAILRFIQRKTYC